MPTVLSDDYFCEFRILTLYANMLSCHGIPQSQQACLNYLADFCWRTNGMTADFVLPGDEAHGLGGSFDRQCIVRLLDEMPLSAEGYDTPNLGRSYLQLAYL